MGQFLAIGLVTEMSVKKAQIEKGGFSFEKLQSEMTKKLHFMPEIYDVSENAEYYSFTLKSEVFYSQLIPFLEAFYPKVYSKPEYYDSIIDDLKAKPPTEWMEWAKRKPEEAFQFDEYGTPSYIDAGFDSIKVQYDAILLSMEGKIGMEVFGRQFNFFKYCMVQTFKEFSIASALRIYITG